jgi:hypothetical protein
MLPARFSRFTSTDVDEEESQRVFYPVALASRSLRFVDPEYEVRHSGIAVHAAERWPCET